MISFSQFTLTNGLQVIVHEDPTVEIAVMNLLYKVGSRNEDPQRTGFAHLFEHLMFGGSVNIPSYDEPLQRVGGENNAFTSPDITNYYLTVPASNLETGFWLESDRMLSLSFDPKALEVQRKVVVEEFKQRYLNQPYGDVWLKLRPLAYKAHPYQWATIGKEPAHIENATMQEVKDFFFRHYRPNNAILVVAGNVTRDRVEKLAQKWFGGIEPATIGGHQPDSEPLQQEKRMLTVEADVPADLLYKVYHMAGRFDTDYFATDLMSDVLGRGQSSRLYQKLVKETEVFTSVSSYLTGSLDPGLVVISGRIKEGITPAQAEEATNEVVKELVERGVEADELEKVKNQAESSLVMGEVEVLNRAMNLAFSALSGDTEEVNREAARIRSVTASDINRLSAEVLSESNASVLYYKANRKS
jgi:zinc protease